MLVFIMLMARRKMVLTICFNTSHVVIYQIEWAIGSIVTGFQYIPCCYLSWMGIVYPESAPRFNTSHVVIYPTSLKHFHFCLSSFTLVLYTIFRFFTSLFEIFLILSQKCFKPLFHLYFKPFSKFYGW